MAGNATKDILHLSYVAEEIGIPFPKPFKLQMDNDAAKCFAEDTVSKSKLKHIDARQEWVKILRDREICTPVHVDSADNLADIFTKILSTEVFERLRDQLFWDPTKRHAWASAQEGGFKYVCLLPYSVLPVGLSTIP